MKEKLKAPWPAFGGKSRIAALVWQQLGDVDNYVEPFCHSAAVLLARPHPPRVETANDLDPYVANFWRATAWAPEEVVRWCDWPVNETDLHARHRWLVLSDDAAAFREQMRTDPSYCDARIAGWWVWGACCWIGGGWCTPPESPAHGPAGGSGKRPPHGYRPHGIHAQGSTCHEQRRPVIAQPGSEGGNGVHGSLPQRRAKLSGGSPGTFALGNGIHQTGPSGTAKRPRARAKSPAGWQQVPDLTGDERVAGPGVHATAGRPQLADAYARGRGVHGNDAAGSCAQRRLWLLGWFARLQDRLRTVRVCCGHWRRVCDSESVTTRLGTTGVLLDPPYALNVARLHAWVRHLRGDGPAPGKKRATSRSAGLYANDAAQDVDRVVAEVHLYCAERGGWPGLRLALCGYDGEHNALEQLGWQAVAWAALGGYGNRSAKGKANAKRERVWFSPGCQGERGLFD